MGTVKRRAREPTQRKSRWNTEYVKPSKPHKLEGGVVDTYTRGKKKPDGSHTKSKIKKNRGYFRKKRGPNKKKKSEKQKQQWEKDWEKAGKHFDKQRKKKSKK